MVQEPAEAQDPEKLWVDAENGLVYLPGTGWMTEESFWEIYYERPEELPGDFDYEALRSIRPEEG